MYQKRNEVLKLYLNNLNARFYLREISKLTGLSLRTTQRILNKLESERIIKSKKEGKNRYYHLNLQNVKTKFYLLIAEIEKTLNFIDKYPIFKTFLRERINSCIVVFGSFAEFKASKNSDLDLLIIGKKPSFYLLPYRVHNINLSEKQFETALKRGELLIKEIVKNHVILTRHSYFFEKLWDYYEEQT